MTMTTSTTGAALATATLACLLSFAPPALASDTKLTNSAFQYSGIRYYRAKAENIRLGSYGEKKTPVGQQNYLSVQNNIKNESLAEVKVSTAGPFTIDWSKQSKSDVEVGVNYFTAAGGKATLTVEKAKSANLKLVKFYMTTGAMTKLLNQSATGARKYLADEGSDGRLVGEVWTVMEASLASSVTTSATITGSGEANGIKVTVAGSTSNTTTTSITIAPDTTFAYLLFKVKWTNNNKDSVDSLEDDQHGVF